MATLDSREEIARLVEWRLRLLAQIDNESQKIPIVMRQYQDKSEIPQYFESWWNKITRFPQRNTPSPNYPPEQTRQSNLPLQEPQIQIDIRTPQDRSVSQDDSFDQEQLDIPIPQNINLQLLPAQHLHVEQDPGFDLQNKILNDGPPLQAFKNFINKQVLNAQSKYESDNPFKAIEFWLVDMLYLHHISTLIAIKNNFIKGDFEYINKLLVSREILNEYGGDDIDENTIKKLFIEFVYRKEEESTLKLIESYSILEPVVELAMVYYMVCQLEPAEGEEFLQEYHSPAGNARKIYQAVSKVFKISLNVLNQSRYLVECGTDTMTIKVRSDGQLESWIL